MTVHCYNCKNLLPSSQKEKISLREECSNCSASLHNCLMCDFFDANAYNSCKEPQAERILDKEKNNFCSYFQLLNDSSKRGNEEDQHAKNLALANSLFKK